MSGPVPPQPGASGGGGPADWFGNHTALGGDDEPRPRRYREMLGLLNLMRPNPALARGLDPYRDLLDGMDSIRTVIDALECELWQMRRAVHKLESRATSAVEVERTGETWSPAPVLGYRVWMMRRGELRGLRVPWPRPELEATCIAPVDQSVPHTYGACLRSGPGCGIYAVKDVERLVSRPRPFIRLMDGVLFGVVALNGKVVEHESGYRAQRARVVAAAVLSVGKLSLGDNPQWIEDVFKRPADAHRPRRGLPGDPPHCRDLYGLDDGLVRRLIADYLRDEARRRTESWT